MFVEGGSEVIASFIAAKKVNQLVTYIAPKLIGGKKSPTVVGGVGFPTMEEVLQLEFVSVERIGADIKIVSRLKE